jgi:ribosomal protein S18 acetylase RimI-like enzyme
MENLTMPSELTNYSFDSMVSEARANDLIQKLTEFNRARSPLWDQNHDDQYSAAPLHLYVQNADGIVIGGLIGRTHSLRSWLEVSILWVDEAYRGQGLGSALIERAEAEAVQRGCLYARLSTGRYQAPEFYAKLGYVLYGTLENCPPGETSYYFWKPLRSPQP